MPKAAKFKRNYQTFRMVGKEKEIINHQRLSSTEKTDDFVHCDLSLMWLGNRWAKRVSDLEWRNVQNVACL